MSSAQNQTKPRERKERLLWGATASTDACDIMCEHTRDVSHITYTYGVFPPRVSIQNFEHGFGHIQFWEHPHWVHFTNLLESGFGK